MPTPLRVNDYIPGVRSLAEIPSELELRTFYTEQYYKLVEDGERVINEPSEWLVRTVFEPILQGLLSGSEYLTDLWLDVGCGVGDFMAYAKEHGPRHVRGIDISPHAVEVAKGRGLDAHVSTIYDHPECHYTAVIMMHYLAHTRNWRDEICRAFEILAPGGLLCIRTANDFNPLQLAASFKHGQYWVSAPDIIHYFTSDGLVAAVKDCCPRFEVVDAWNDFPMATFLLAGQDYTGAPDVGAECHARRVEFDLSLSDNTRMELYRLFNLTGIGRCTHLILRKKQ